VLYDPFSLSTFLPSYQAMSATLQALDIVTQHGEPLCRSEYHLFCFRARCICGDYQGFCVRCDEIGDGRDIEKGAQRTKLAGCCKELYSRLEPMDE